MRRYRRFGVPARGATLRILRIRGMRRIIQELEP